MADLSLTFFLYIWKKRGGRGRKKKKEHLKAPEIYGMRWRSMVMSLKWASIVLFLLLLLLLWRFSVFFLTFPTGLDWDILQRSQNLPWCGISLNSRWVMDIIPFSKRSVCLRCLKFGGISGITASQMTWHESRRWLRSWPPLARGKDTFNVLSLKMPVERTYLSLRALYLTGRGVCQSHVWSRKLSNKGL